MTVSRTGSVIRTVGIESARGSIARRAVLWQNALKVRALERKVISQVDVLSAICDEDLDALQVTLPREQTVVLTPGYSGPMAASRKIRETTLRRVVIVGSFRWVLKQENLARFIESADPVFAGSGIQLDIVGDVPDELLAVLKPKCSATTFHGFVDDMGPLLSQARIAVVPELIGGGFKLKFLDYFFGRVPVATLSGAAAGLPSSLRDLLIQANDVSELVERIAANIDELDRLNDLQDRAFQVARMQFRWEDRGVRLKQAIAHLQHEWQQLRHGTRDNAKAYAARPT